MSDIEEEKIVENKKSFRMQYKEIGLTYSRCPIPRDEIIRLLQEKFEFTDYYVAQETHKEEKECSTHLHVWLEAANKPNIRNQNFFDVEYLGSTYHPNIGKKKRNWIHNYLKKQDKEPYTNIPEGYIALAQAGMVDEAISKFAFDHPKEFIIHHERVIKTCSILGKRKREHKVFEFTGDKIEWDWDQKSLLVIDEPGKGKTEWAKSFCKEMGWTYLRVTHLDGLKKYNGEDVIIYDDVNFSHLPRETQIHIAEVRNEKSIHCRHACAEIPAGVKNIILGNAYPFSNFEPAIERRLEKAPYIRFY